MKKKISLILALIIAFSALGGCTVSKNDKDDSYKGESYYSADNNDSERGLGSDENDDEANETVSTVLENSPIVFSGKFSEGLCLVEFENEPDVMYCIEKNGNVRFRLEVKDSPEYKEFVNGFVYLSNEKALCDKDGNLTYPEDVGATKFYLGALAEGYIIADVVTADFSSTKTEVGIMNTDFEWVVAPNEELYNKLCNEYGGFVLSTNDNNRQAYNGYYYISGLKSFIELATGEIYYYTDIPFEFPIWCAALHGDYTYRDPGNNILIDLSEYYGNTQLNCGNFNGDYAPVVFYNYEADISYLTLIDKNGEFAFEPVEIWEGAAPSVEFDGNFILIENSIASASKVKCFNTEGELVGEMYPDDSSRSTNNHYNLSGGVIVYHKSFDYMDYEYSFYNPDFTPLF